MMSAQSEEKEKCNIIAVRINNKMSYPLIILFSLVILSSTFQKTFWYVGGFRLFLSDVLIIVFLALYMLRKILKDDTNFSLISKNYLLFNTPLLLLMPISYLVVLTTQQVSSIELFAKGFILFFFNIVFQVFAIDFISKTEDNKQFYYPLSFLLGGLISVVYSAIQVYTLSIFGTDIDKTFLETIFSESWHEGISGFGQLYRISGLLADPNHFGIVINISIGIAIALLWHNRSIFNRLLFQVILICLFVTMVYTFSRSSGIVLLISTMFMLFFGKLSLKGTIKTFVLIAVFLLTILTLLYIQPDSLPDVIKYQLNSGLDSSVVERMELYVAGLDIWYGNFFLGVGFNNFSSAYYALTGVAGYNAHNAWITYLVEMGIIGFVFYLVIYLYILRSAYATMYSKNGFFSKLGVVYFSFFFAVLIGNLFYNTLGWNYVIAFQVLILGLRAKDFENMRM